MLRQTPGAARPARSPCSAHLYFCCPHESARPALLGPCHRLPRAENSCGGYSNDRSLLSSHFPHCVWRRGLKGPVFSPEGPSRRVPGRRGTPADALSRAPPPGSAWSGNYMNPVVCPPPPHPPVSTTVPICPQHPLLFTLLPSCRTLGPACLPCAPGPPRASTCWTPAGSAAHCCAQSPRLLGATEAQTARGR